MIKKKKKNDAKCLEVQTETLHLPAGGAVHSAGVTTNRAEVEAHKKLISSTVQVR